VSSGKLNAPSMALDVVPISNHCSSGIFCGWKKKWKPLSLTSTVAVALARTSIGSPSSRFAWHTLEVAGTPGNCQFGAGLLTKGFPNASLVSCDSAVTSSNPAPKSPGEIQLAYWVTQRDSGKTSSLKYV